MDQREWKKITFRFKEPLPEAEEKGFDATFDRSQTPLRAAVEGGVGSANDSGSSWEVSNGVKGGSWSNSGIIGKNGLGLPCEATGVLVATGAMARKCQFCSL